MKPIKLIMNAFGSFLQTTEIDFTQLNNAGIYLITGATGSGKTTIFDAIMFALYGEASGDVRSNEGFRSDFADDKNPTYVEFTFEKDNIIYKVTRSPRYVVEYRATPLEAKASLVYEHVVIEKTNLVNDAIHEIIGLTASQFKQVIMLAQGEFMKLIHAKSQERDEIFRKIFGTEIFEKITRLLKEETKEVKDKLKLNEELIKQLIVNIPEYDLYQNYASASLDLNNTSYLLDELQQNILVNTSSLNELENQINQFSKDVLDLNAHKETAKIINEEFNNLSKAQEKLNTLQINKDTIMLKKERINDLNEIAKIKPSYDNLLNLNLQITSLSNTYETNKTILEEKQETLNFFIDQSNMIELDRISLKNLMSTKEEIELNISLKKDIEKEHIKIAEKEKEIVTFNNQLKELSIKEADTLQSIDELKAKIKDLNKYSTTFEVTQNNINTINNEIKSFNDNISLYNEAVQIKQSSETLILSYQELLKNYNDAHTEYQLLEKAYFNNLAGILAQELKDNMPCPVCGSINHPNIAKLNHKVVSKTELDNFYNQVESIRNKKDQKLLEIEKENAKYSSIIKQLLNTLQISDETMICQTIDNVLQAYQTDLQIQTQKLEDCMTKLEMLKKCENELTSKENLLQTTKNQITQTNTLIQSSNNLLSIALGKVSALEEKLTFSNDVAELELAKEERIQAIEMLEEAINGFDKEYNLAKEEHQLIKGKVEENLDQLTTLKSTQDETLNAYNELISSLNIKKQIKENIDLYINELSNLSNYVKEVTEYEVEYNACSNTIEELKIKLENKVIENITVIEEQITNKENELSNIKDLYNKLKITLAKQQQVFKDLTKSFKEYQKLHLQYEDINQMSLASSGQNNKYISFERFVLVEYFDSILNHANVRLKKMTNGRYLLYRKVDKSKGRAQQGLDMEIFDFETGKRRDVKTLSGGETFKAALSLALGLADAIENKVGNITIDTLFIDEGFGTLDEESLNQAIEILLELNDGNKTIGIISHVQELKDLISTKLVVSKTDEGSRVKILV